MKKYLFPLLLCGILSCSQEKKPVVQNSVHTSNISNTKEEMSELGKILEGKHNYRDLHVDDGVVTFRWENKSKEWMLFKVRESKVRYIISDDTEPNKIKFRWTPSCLRRGSLEENMTKNVVYVVIEVDNLPQINK